MSCQTTYYSLIFGINSSLATKAAVGEVTFQISNTTKRLHGRCNDTILFVHRVAAATRADAVRPSDVPRTWLGITLARDGSDDVNVLSGWVESSAGRVGNRANNIVLYQQQYHTAATRCVWVSRVKYLTQYVTSGANTQSWATTKWNRIGCAAALPESLCLLTSLMYMWGLKLTVSMPIGPTTGCVLSRVLWRTTLRTMTYAHLTFYCRNSLWFHSDVTML